MASSSLNSICAIESVILLKIKCPHLSKPEVTARNQNSICDRTEKKTLGETRLSQGASSPLARLWRGGRGKAERAKGRAGSETSGESVGK